ncbi:efflux RND transporter permease subunit [Paraburkholderia graminis]|uniref:Acriflavin resistance protein n=1 Tax=Paraburkholderia graminis (strain ATCC 700544 / DSM 17151 / LMG 18924 / NCIMB 13744 / C4D1M) TaxID=396598 RepID=B1GAK6_PARG4|nr:efflux RND transporter permease subunit [Paraburkholderia graminis]EDT06862.1 acriflavin resistance protein [Paraburkholderia graminis C4D1M]
MNPSRAFILRPVGTALLMAAIMLVGLVALRFLPLSALPQVDYPTIQCRRSIPGASLGRDDVIRDCARSSVSSDRCRRSIRCRRKARRSSIITLQFNLDLPLDIAEQEVQAAINAAGNLLPSDLPAPPIYAKVNPADAPILTLAITSKTLPLTQVQDLADTRLAQKISQVAGVGLVSLSGGQRPAVRIQANPRALAAYGLNLDDLRTTISNLNVNTPKGNFDGPTRNYTINANDQLTDADAYKSAVVAYKSGRPVMLTDVATIVQGPENTKLGAWVDGTPAIILNVQRQPGANVIQVVDNIKKLLPQLQQSLPAALEVRTVTDRTTTIRASVRDVQFELAMSVVLVVLVMYLFLANVYATIIPSLSVPLSLIGTLAVMYLCGFSLDNLSLMALTIATGFVVDDAIVMIENIARYVEEGEPPLEAALKGSKQIGFTIISLTVSLIAVLIPLLFMGDVVGRLFHEFAITLAVTIVISAIVSLTLVPMMCAKLLRHTPPHESHRFEARAHRAIDWVIARYAVALTWVLDRERSTLVVAVLTLVLTALLYVFIPKGFFPVQDTGVIQAITQAPQSVSYASMAERQQELAAQILKNPDVQSLTSFIGVDGSNITLNSGRMLINLKPRDDRSSTASEVIRQLQQDVAHIAGASLYMQPVQDLTIDSTVSPTQYQFMLTDPNMSEFTTWVPKLVERLKEAPELADVATDLQDNGQSVYVEIDRATASRYGITPATVDSALYDAFGQRIVSTIFTQSNQYRVILEAQPSMQHYTESLNSIYLPSSTSSGGQVPLSAIAKFIERPAPLLVTHLSQFPATTVSFNLAPGSSLGAAVKAIDQAQKDIGCRRRSRRVIRARRSRSSLAVERTVPDSRGHRHDV